MPKTLPGIVKPIDGVLKINRDIPMDELTLATYISAFRTSIQPGMIEKRNRYNNIYPILDRPQRDLGKPDNRLICNFCKYAVDTLNGFFIGNPVKITTEDEKLDEYVNRIDTYNDTDDKNAEIAKMASIYGYAYEMYYTDEAGELAIAYLSPCDAFMIYDESILQRPLYFVRIYTDIYGTTRGSISDSYSVRYFAYEGAVTFEGEEEPHGFDGVPATCYLENKEGRGLTEPVASLIDAYNVVISGKADDVDYFADAYLAVLGAKVAPKDVKTIREKRLINVTGTGGEKVDVKFLVKPSADGTQENLLNRLERLIFEISMVTDIASKEFGNASGVALKYKLWAMNTLAKNKERKFVAAFNRRYKLLFSHPLSEAPADAWAELHYKFTPNFPQNLQEEAQTAASLKGITSTETALGVLSIVDDVKREMDRMERENAALADMYGQYSTDRTGENGNILAAEADTT